jgi:hypothetical protein
MSNITKGKEYIRVTDVLFPFSGLKGIDKTILKKAGERGQKVHELCTSFVQGLGVFDIPKECAPYFESFKDWDNANSLAQFPGRLYCDKYGITGEIDGVYFCPERKKYILFDWKTSAKESKTWKLQGSAYAYLLRQSGQFDVGGIEFVKLSKTGGKPEVFKYEEDFGTFLKCLDLYHYFFKEKVDEYEYL